MRPKGQGKFVYIMDYSNGFCAVFGLLKSSKDKLKALGGKFLGGNFAMHRFVRNPPLSDNIKASGWRFSADRRQDLIDFYHIDENAQEAFPHAPTLKFSKEDAFNQLEAIKSYNKETTTTTTLLPPLLVVAAMQARKMVISGMVIALPRVLVVYGVRAAPGDLDLSIYLHHSSIPPGLRLTPKLGISKYWTRPPCSLYPVT